MPNRLVLYIFMLSLSASCDKNPPADPDPTPDTPSEVEIKTRVAAQGLQFPWEIIWGPDNFIWMTERRGVITRVNPADGSFTPVASISGVVSQGEGGLLGMALHPDFQNIPHVFVAYNYDKNGAYTEKVVRYTFNGTTLEDPLVLIDDIEAAGIHNGCRLVIRSNKLFITTGDASNESLPQNFASKNGKVLRINLDGSVPADNPDPASPVWSTGHRNAQGLVFVGDSLYSSEHGPANDDEINLIHRAANYGWPDVEGDCDANEQPFCDEHNVVEPLIKWTPTLAVSGMDYYNSDSIPQWKNSLLVCTLKESKLMQLKLNESGGVTEAESYFTGEFGRLRDACISPDGKVYVCTSNGNNDKIIEIGRK